MSDSTFTPERIEALETLAKAATPGQWSVAERNNLCFVIAPQKIIGHTAQGKTDASYLVAAQPQVLLALLAELKSFMKYEQAFNDAKAADRKARIRAQKEKLWLARQAAEIVSKTRRKVKPTATEWMDMAKAAIDEIEQGEAS